MTPSSGGIIQDSGATTSERSASLESKINAAAAAMFYEYRLNELGNEFAARSLSPVIVKGQAIVDLAFPKDEIRLSGDVDLVVGADGEAVVRALADMGYQEGPPHSRHFKFGERGFSQHDERLPGYVEVHRCLDKILLRPIPYADILTRAKPSGRQGFRYPSIEDLILLVVLHASADIFFEPERVRRDLHFLLECGKPDMNIVRVRARQWELSRALRRLLDGRYPQEAVASGDWSASRTATYLLGQVLWHDSLLTVLRGLANYGLARLRDRFVR